MFLEYRRFRSDLGLLRYGSIGDSAEIAVIFALCKTRQMM